MSVELSGNVIGETLITNGTFDSANETLLTTFEPCIYRTRMTEYYPKVISAITEFKAIIDAECPEIETLNIENQSTLNDAYLLTMGEERVEEWERILGIVPIVGSSVEDRRDTIVARIRGQGKLNTELINSIVNAFTGGKANSWIANSTLYVEITPPPGNKAYQFSNVEQELQKKVPAHLGFQVSRNYYEWGDINTNFATWNAVKTEFATWNDVYLYVPSWT